MPFDLAAALPLLAPKAIAWAQQRAAEIAASGTALTAAELTLAQRVGVAHPQRIRLAFVDRLPMPDDALLRQAAMHTGMLGPDAIGLTLGHGIYIRNGYQSSRLLSHECRHVRQYEDAGSIAAYLPDYLRQIAEYGYTDAPFEVDARAHEIDG